jgi:polysaccharide pyruvyl transferase WcaK-like protein
MVRNVGGSTIDIGLNLAFHGPFASGLSQRAMPILVQVLKRLSATMPCRFSYFCHADSARGIVAALRAKGVQLNVYGGSVDQLLAGYRQLDVHIGAMMHSTILAISCGVPTLALAYDVKSVGFFELFGLGNQVVPLPTLDEETLYHRIVDLVAQRSEIAAIISSKGRQLRQSSREFYNDIPALTLTSSRFATTNGAKTQ